MAIVWIALGSNLGERAVNLETAINLMGDDVCVLAKSSLYQTKPWGYLAQDDFYNQVLVGETSLRPQKLLSRLKGIEKQMGRKKTIRNGPRVIDLDILLYDDLLLHSKRLTIPHPRMHERAFVLVPLVELQPDLVHPELGLTMSALLAKVDRAGIVRL